MNTCYRATFANGRVAFRESTKPSFTHCYYDGYQARFASGRHLIPASAVAIAEVEQLSPADYRAARKAAKAAGTAY